MCLAVPAKVYEVQDDLALVDLSGVRTQVSTVMTPEVEPGMWVIVHAGFAINAMTEEEAMETIDVLNEVLRDPEEEE